MSALSEVRATRLFSIRDLAQQARVAPSTIYLMEIGRLTPSLNVVRRLATALDIQIAEVDEFRPAIERAQQAPPARHVAARG